MRWLALLLVCGAARAEVSYQLDLSQRDKHVVLVEMKVRGGTGELTMPVWTPGAYELRHWGRNVTPLSAEDAAGRPIAFERTGPDRFRVGAGDVTLKYRVYAAELSDDASQIDATHAYLNGTSIFLAARGQEQAHHHVTIVAPPGWRVATALEETATGWDAPGYEALIDAPIEVGRFAHAEVHAAGRIYRVAVDGASAVPALLAHDLVKIADCEAALMGTPPYRRYQILIHLSDGIGRIAALEHAASTSIVIPRRAISGGGETYDELLYVLAHELFHAWNARRLRPAELVPYDLSREQTSRSLWITEGITEYYAHRVLRLTGLWSKTKYLDRVSDQATRALQAEARGLTLEEASELAWQPPDEAAADPDAYYARGHLVALALDARIRTATAGKKSLDDVMRLLLADSERAGGILPVDGARLAQAVSRVAPGEAAEVATWTRAPHELDHMKDALAQVGLALVREETPARTFAGFSAEPDGSTLRVVAVGPAGPAEEAGLRAGDRILRLDGAVPGADWAEQLAKKSPGVAVMIEAVRATRRLLIELRLESTSVLSAHLEETAVSPSALAIREALLGR